MRATPRLRVESVAYRDRIVLLRKSALRRGADFGILTMFCGLGVETLSKEDVMCMLDKIRAKRDEIYAIARKHKAEKLWVFGSCARKEERPDSDVDFLVKFSPEVGYRDYVAIEQGVSDIVGRDVDVVSSRVLPSSPRFADRVCREAVAI